MVIASPLLVLSSCEKRSEYQNIIDDRTTDTISIYLKGTSAYVSGTDTIIALPKKQTIYYDSEGWRISAKNHTCDSQLSSNEITVVISSGKKLIKDLANDQNWNCETDKENSFWKYVFKIHEDDLE